MTTMKACPADLRERLSKGLRSAIGLRPDSLRDKAEARIQADMETSQQLDERMSL